MPDAREATSCSRCGATVPNASRYCGSCGSSMSQEVNPTVAAAVARSDKLSDSGALQLRQLLVDATGGEYEIMGELGRGGMAVVYRATEIHLSRTVAIKILPPELTFTKGASERFQREAKTAAALDHPNIIPIYRISSGGRLFWYAMKFLEGRSLAEILTEKGLLTVSETVAILEQVGNALDYAHQHGVIHRDVKPGNVMLDVNGRVTVTDFGIAKELTSGALTGSGAILGTPYYMSPEQCRGGASISGASDQYSLGVMAYQMVSGQLPFEADSAIDVIHKHVAEQPPPLEQILPGLPKHVINAITRAISKRADERFPTVQAFVNAMKNEPADVTLVIEKRRADKDKKRRSGVPKAPAIQSSTRHIVIGTVLVGTLVAVVLWLNNRAHGVDQPASSLAVAPGAAPSSARSPRPVPPATRTSGPPPAPAPPAGNQVARQDAPARPASGPPQAVAPENHATTNPAPQPAPQGASTPGGSATPAPAPAPVPAPATPPAPAARQGFVRVSLTNTFANFTIAGKTVTERRGFADSVPPGLHTLTISREGYQTVTRTVSVRPGQPTVLPSITLQRSQP